MKKIRKKVTILLFLLFSGMLILMCTHLNTQSMELNVSANAEN